MNKIKKAVFAFIFVISFFALTDIVFAKETFLTCEYNFFPSSESGSRWRKVKLVIYDDYSHDGYLSIKDGAQNNAESVLNWDNAFKDGDYTTTTIVKDWIKENNRCPEYVVFIDTGGIFDNWKLYAGDRETVDTITMYAINHKKWYSSQIIELTSDSSHDNLAELDSELLETSSSLQSAWSELKNMGCSNDTITENQMEQCQNKKDDLITKLYQAKLQLEDAVRKGIVLEDVFQTVYPGAYALNNSIDTIQSELVNFVIAQPINNITCNYMATINGQTVSLSLYKSNSFALYKREAVVSNGFSLKYNKYSSLDYAISEIDTFHSSVLGSFTKLQCIPKIAYDVNGTVLDMASNNLLEGIYYLNKWDNFFTLTSISITAESGTTSWDDFDNTDQAQGIFKNRIFNATEMKHNWLFGGVINEDFLGELLGVRDPNFDGQIPECASIFGGNFGEIIKKTLSFSRFLAPIILVVLSGIDFIKAIVSQDQDNVKVATTRFVKRLVIAILIFVTATIVYLILNIFGITPGQDVCIINN